MKTVQNDICQLGLAEGCDAVRSRRISAREWMAACCNRIARLEPKLRAWVDFDAGRALSKADEIDAKLAGGSETGLIVGAPIGVKDIFNTDDLPTQMGSPIWKGFTPGNNARVVDRILWNGGIVAGKTVTAEFAVHHPGDTVNPFDPARTPGTSSSGSAAAVAAGMVPAALGTQTLGSLIRPASYCGVYAFKPTFGMIPRTGILKTTDTLDQVGFFARSVADLRLLFEVLRVDGPNYPFSETSREHDTDTRPFKTHLVRTESWEHAADYSRKSMERLATDLSRLNSVDFQESELPFTLDEARQVHQSIYAKCLAYYFSDELAQHPTLVSESMKRMVSDAAAQSSDDYQSALRRQTEMRQALDETFEQTGADILLSLSAAGEAPLGLEAPNDPDNLLIWTLCGVPVINIPAFKGPNGMPVGCQIIARRYHDYRLLRFAQHLVQSGLAPGVAPLAPEIA